MIFVYRAGPLSAVPASRRRGAPAGDPWLLGWPLAVSCGAISGADFPWRRAVSMTKRMLALVAESPRRVRRLDLLGECPA